MKATYVHDAASSRLLAEVQRAVAAAVARQTEALERLCAEALRLQHPDRVGHLTVLRWQCGWPPATVGSLLFDTARCPHGDHTCPCQDGLACHYEPAGGTKPMRCPRTGRTDGGCCR